MNEPCQFSYNNLIDVALNASGIYLEPDELADMYLIAPLLVTGYISGQIPDIQAFDNNVEISSTSTKKSLLEHLFSSGLAQWNNEGMLWMTAQCIERYKEPLIAISLEGWKSRTSDTAWLRKFGKTEPPSDLDIYKTLIKSVEIQPVSTRKI